MIGIDLSKNTFHLAGSDKRVSGSAAGDYFGCRLIEMTYAVACQISSSLRTSRQAGMRRPFFSRPSAIDWKMPLGSSSRCVRLMPPLPSTP